MAGVAHPLADPISPDAGRRPVVDARALHDALALEISAAPVAPSKAMDTASDAGHDRRGPFRPNALVPTRSRLSGTMLARMFRLIDTSVISVVTLTVLSDGRVETLLSHTVAAVLPFILGAFLISWSLRSARAYAFPQRERLAVHLARVSAALAIPGALVLGLAHVTAHGLTAMVALWIGALLASLACVHGWGWARVRRWRKAGRLTPNVVLVGANQNGARLIEAALASREIAVLGVFDDRSDRAPAAILGVPVLGDTRRLLEHQILPYVDKIVITVTTASEQRVRELLDRLRVLPNAVTLFMDVEGQDTRAATLSRLAATPLSQLAGVEYDERRTMAKRLQDLTVGALALIVAAPVMAAVALAVRLDSPGPVLFRQKRHGFNNETITVWKFRSMREDAEDPAAARQISAGDDRVTRVGRFIRATSLDELPQLWNVLTGEMSLVGPRPHAIGMKTAGEQSSRLVAEYAWRHRMKPGITGWAQIKGSRGPVDTAEAVRRRIAYDIDYIERQSFWFDLYILAMTLPCLFGDTKAVR